MHKFTYLNPIISYLILFLAINFVIYSIDSSSISFDSIDNYQDTFFIRDNNNSDANDSTADLIHPTALTSLSRYDKMRRWLHWRVYGNEKYVTAKEFNLSWKPTDHIKSKFKDELKEFKKGPVDFLKKDLNERKILQKEIHRRNLEQNPRDLNKMASTIKDKIVKKFR